VALSAGLAVRMAHQVLFAREERFPVHQVFLVSKSLSEKMTFVCKFMIQFRRAITVGF
jgi:hypothetical protein